MSHMSPKRHTWGIVPLALALTLMIVLAAPAAARGPVLYSPVCGPVVREDIKASPRVRALCERRAAAGESQSVTGKEAGIIAGGVAVLVLMIAGGMLGATHRRDAHVSRPAVQS
jgi:hypothetical protein